MSLQWRHNGEDIAGATNEILRLTNLVASASGTYTVVASTIGGTQTSSAAGLKISGAVQMVGSVQQASYGFSWERGPLLRVLTNGDSLIAARSNNPTNRTSLMLLKHNAAGALLWSALSPAGELTNSEPIGLGYDTAGNIYLAGICEPPSTNAGLVLLKYSLDGQLLWSRSLAGTNQSPGMVTAFALDPDGTSTIGMLGLYGTVLVRYSNAGDIQWSAYDLSPDTDTLAVAVDAAGNSYIGTTIRTNNDTVVVVHQITAEGATNWSRTFAEGMYNRLGALTVDGSDNLIVAGTGYLEVPDSRMFVIKYNPAGDLLWVTRTGKDWGEISAVRAVAIDQVGEITVMSSSDDDYTPEHTGLTRIGPGGQLRYRIQEPQILVYYPSQLALDNFGNAYITGYGGREGSGVDVVTAKYDANGYRPWVVYHGGPNMGWEYAAAVGADGKGDIRVLGMEGVRPDSSVELNLLHYMQADPAGNFRLQLVRDPARAFHLTAPTGATVRIETSTDLREWSELGAEETQRLLEPGGTEFASAHRFYRLVRGE